MDPGIVRRVLCQWIVFAALANTFESEESNIYWRDETVDIKGLETWNFKI